MRLFNRAIHIPVLDGINVDCIDVGLDEASPTYALFVQPWVVDILCIEQPTCFSVCTTDAVK